MLRIATTLGAAIAAVALILASPLSAAAVVAPQQPAVTPLPVGADISYPQEDGPYPVGQLFGMVGVNNGFGTHSNPYFAEQLAWAQKSYGGSSAATVGLYVNTANPSAGDAHWWPKDDRTRTGRTVAVPSRYGTCRRVNGEATNSAACSYVYGWSIADDDYTIRGPADGEDYRWWLDVEVANDWVDSTTAHVANLEGMVAAFASHHAAAGVYASRDDWAKIVGTPKASSSLSRLPSWIAGGNIVHAQAQLACERSGLTESGRYALVQYVSKGQDYDVPCNRFTRSARPTITGSAHTGRTLTAHTGNWHVSGIAFGYRWERNGKTIAGAVHSRYRLTKADVGKTITVVVTAKRSQYNTASRTSTGTKAHSAVATGTSSAGLAPAPAGSSPAASGAPIQG